MGPGRARRVRTAPGRPSGAVRRAAGGCCVSRQAWGCSIAARPGGRHVASHASPTTRRVRMRGCGPHRKRVAQVPWCADLPCGSVWICRADPWCGSTWICRAALSCGSYVDLSCGTDDPGLTVRHVELVPVSQTGMIEVLTMHRQYSPQENFRFSPRKFLASDGPDGEPPLPPSSNAVASTPGRGSTRVCGRRPLDLSPQLGHLGMASGIRALRSGPGRRDGLSGP